jgi:hypothetical protein
MAPRKIFATTAAGGALRRRGAQTQQSDEPRRVESRMAPPKRAERQHARPGAGIKRARAAMLPKPRSRG